MERTEARTPAKRLTNTFIHQTDPVATQSLVLNPRIDKGAGVRPCHSIRRAVRETPHGSPPTRASKIER